MAAFTFDMLDEQYRQLWDSMSIKPAKATDIDATARKILAKKTRYQAVERETHVPWFMIGAIHALECGLRFDRHLHCGDPLTRRTVHVPKGRPIAAPKNGSTYTWEESAIDALAMPPHSLNKVPEWPIERICYEAERYNGFGYRSFHPETLSPYLWSGSNKYASGKYVADGKWSSTAVSGQSGAMPIIKRLSELDPEVAAAIGAGQHEDEHPETISEQVERAPDPAMEFPKTDAGTPPPASAAPAVAVTPAAQMTAHADLVNTSTFYNARRWILKFLGVSGGTGGIGLLSRAQDDPVGVADSLLNFAKAHGLWIAAAILVAVIILERLQFNLRKTTIVQGQEGAQ